VIPASQVSPQAYATLMEYLRYEIPKALSDRAPLEERWRNYQYGYRAIPAEAEKQFPFVGAANLVLPIIATDVDTVFSRLMGIIFAPDNLWSCKPLNPMMVEYAPRLQEFLEWAQNAELGVYRAVGDFFLEMCKLGTGILKTRYTRETRKVYQFRETDQGTLEQIVTLMIKDHPEVGHVSLPDFLLPGSASDIQTSPWCSERLSVTWGQLQNRIHARIYTGGDRLARWNAVEHGGKMVEAMQTLDAFKPGFGDKFELWETWLDYDIGGTGEPMAIVATIHLPTNTCLRVDYNPFFNQEKPYDVARYLTQEKRFYGIGLAEMLDPFQDEVSTMHNQRLDNATIANSSMFWARKGVGIRENEPIIPGRWFLVENKDDIGTLSMGQRYDSTVPYEELTLNYASRRTGVSDWISAADNPTANYAPATTAVQQLREGSKRFDQVLRESRRCLGSVGTKVVELYQQYNQSGKEYLAMGMKDGQMVHQVLQFPLQLIRYSVGIELTATSASLNKEVEIRTNQIILGMVMQFYQQMMQGMQIASSPDPMVTPPMRQMALTMVQGAVTLMRRILDAHGIQDVDELVPKIQDILNGGQQQLGAIQGGQPFGGGTPGFGQSNGAPGLQNPVAGYPGASPNGLQFSGAGQRPY
jgi:hypothetical protein